MDTDVLVVGAGPTGLTLAGELASRGVACRIIDREPARRPESRALVVQPRTLELADKWGGAEKLVARGFRDLGVEVFVNGVKKAEIDLHDTGERETRFPFLLFISQRETERVLDERLDALGVTIERSVELTGVVEDEAGVTSRFADGRTVRSRWIVGCDGAHSVVRKSAGMTFEGAAYEQEFLLADVRMAQAPERLRFYLSDRGLIGMFPLAEGVVRFIGSRTQAAAGTGPLGVDEMRSVLADLLPEVPAFDEPIWLSRFHLHHRGVDHYRRGRMFVAGDAAHIHSPAGGQGMNTGIQDSINLAWKLALVAQGRAPDELLDSYEAERQPVGARLLRTTDRLFSFAASQNRVAITLRNFLFPRMARLFLASPARRRMGFRFVSQLAIAYPGSPIVGDAPGLRVGPRPGERMPDFPLEGGGMLHEKLRGPKFHLLLVTREEVPAPEVPADLVETHRIEPIPALGERALYLVRPDGHVAYRAPGLDADAVAEALRTTLLTP